MSFQEGFDEVVAAADECCTRRFGFRLLATYVAGSVAAGEAWPGASDLDWWVFLDAKPTRADESWRRRTEKRLCERFPVVTVVHFAFCTLDTLREEAFWRFILRYNSVLVSGGDVTRMLWREGVRTPRPSKRLARGRLPFVKTCLSEAMQGRTPPALEKLPDNPFLATRKLVRNFVLVEGAFALMLRGKFKSFRLKDVFDGLRRLEGRWKPLLELAEVILADPLEAAVRSGEFMQLAEPFVLWAIEEEDTDSAK